MYPVRGSMSQTAVQQRTWDSVQNGSGQELEEMHELFRHMSDQFDEAVKSARLETGIDAARGRLMENCLHLLGYDTRVAKEAPENKAVEQRVLENFPTLFIQYAIYDKSVPNIKKFFERYPNFREGLSLADEKIVWAINEQQIIEAPIKKSLMHIAVNLGSLAIAQILHQQNQPIDMQAERLNNPLQTALIFIFSRPAHVKDAQSQRYRLAEFLIEKYGELDRQDGQDRINQESLMEKTEISNVDNTSFKINMTVLDKLHQFKEEQSITETHEMYSNLSRLENLLVANGAKTTTQLALEELAREEPEGSFFNPIEIDPIEIV